MLGVLEAEFVGHLIEGVDSDYELNQKLVRFALGRGFTFDIIRQCIQVDEEMEFTDETD